MTMRFRVYPYKTGSKSAKTLATALGGKVLRRADSKFSPREDDVIVNWGSSGIFYTSEAILAGATVLNPDIEVAQCKLSAFRYFKEHGVSIPPFWENRGNIPDGVYPIVCRTSLYGHSGDGIVIANRKEDLVDAPLYTQYMKKKHEYRVHVMTSPDYDPDVTQYEAFFIQRKAKKNGFLNPDWQVRNLAGGFSYKEVLYNDTPPHVICEAYKAMAALGLDFGGVDVIYNETLDKAYVLEINTACGLEERTALKYAESIRTFLLTNSQIMV